LRKKYNGSKILIASAVLGSAFVAATPAGAVSVKHAEELVVKAETLANQLRWAISIEGEADGKTIPWKTFNETKEAYNKAIKAVKGLPTKDRIYLETRLANKVALYISTSQENIGRAVAYIDAITAGQKIKEKSSLLETKLKNNQLDQSTVSAYHALSTEIRKQSHLLDRVYGYSTRQLIREQFKGSAEEVKLKAMYLVSIKLEVDSGKLKLALKDKTGVAESINKIESYFKEGKEKGLLSETNSMVKELRSTYTELQQGYAGLITIPVPGPVDPPPVVVPGPSLPPSTSFPGSGAVSSMNANAKEIKIKYSSAVLAETAVNTSNYIVSINNDKYDTKLEVDNLLEASPNGIVYDPLTYTVTLRLKSTLQNGDRFSVDIRDGVLSADKSTKIQPYMDTPKVFNDLSAPRVQSVQYTGGKLKLTFDEPVLPGFSVTVDGQPIAVGSISNKINDYTAETVVIPDSLKALGTHQVLVYNATDLSTPTGNKAAILNTSYTISSDTTPPTVKEIKQDPNNDRKFIITFTESLQQMDLNKLLIKKGSYVFGTGTGSPVGGNTTYSAVFAGDQVVVTFSGDAGTPLNPLYGNENSASISIQVEGHKDYAGLVGSKYNSNLTMYKDVNAPTVTNPFENYLDGKLRSETDTDGKLVLYFNKNLQGSTIDLNKLKVTDKTGLTRTVSSATINGNLVTLTLEGLTDRDQLEGKAGYQVNFASGAVQGTNHVWNTNFTTVVHPTRGIVTPVVEALTSSDVTVANNVITVRYNTAMDTSSASSLSNYTLDNGAFPYDSKISIDGSNKVVTITLPEGYTNANISKLLTVSKNVKASNGSVLVGDIATKEAFSTQIAIKDNVKPTFVSAKYLVDNVETSTTTKEIKLTFSENLKDTFASGIADDFKVLINGTPQDVDAIVDTDKGDKVLVLVLKEGANLIQAATISVVPEGSGKTLQIVDANDNKLSTGTVVTTSGKEKK
jgi:trimeric autotransporter adhesin